MTWPGNVHGGQVRWEQVQTLVDILSGRVSQAVTLKSTLALLGSTSGTATITAAAVAGTPTLTLPTTTGTLALTGHDMLSGHVYSGGAALDVFGLSAASTLAKLTPSANPGAAAAILKTGASGLLQLVGLGVGAAAAANAITMANNAYIGLSATTGRITFIDATPDIISFADCNLEVDDGAYVGYTSGPRVVFDNTNTRIQLTGGAVILDNHQYIGQAAGPQIAFDDTNNYLEITGGNVAIGTTVATYLLQLKAAGDASQDIILVQSADGGTLLELQTTAAEHAVLNLRNASNAAQVLLSAADYSYIKDSLYIGSTPSDPGVNNLYVQGDCSALTFTDRP